MDQELRITSIKTNKNKIFIHLQNCPVATFTRMVKSAFDVNARILQTTIPELHNRNICCGRKSD